LFEWQDLAKYINLHFKTILHTNIRKSEQRLSF